jgi:archaellin
MSLIPFWVMAGRSAAEGLAAPVAAVRHVVGSNPAPRAGGFPADALTAIGTLVLAFVTVAALLATILISRHGDRQLRDERREAQAQEQMAEAVAVQVLGAATTVVINHGRYTISDITARLELSDGSQIEFNQAVRVLSVEGISAELHASQALQFERTFRPNMLTSWDVGLRLDADPARITSNADAYPIVHWQDRWGNYWEHRLGQVRLIGKRDDWPPSPHPQCR